MTLPLFKYDRCIIYNGFYIPCRFFETWKSQMLFLFLAIVESFLGFFKNSESGDFKDSVSSSATLCMSKSKTMCIWTGNGIIASDSLVVKFITSLSFNTPPHNSDGVLWFHVGRPCVCPSVRQSYVRISFSDDNLSKPHQTWYVHWYCGGLVWYC